MTLKSSKKNEMIMKSFEHEKLNNSLTRQSSEALKENFYWPNWYALHNLSLGSQSKSWINVKRNVSHAT